MIATRLALLAVLLALLVLPAASSAPAAAQGVGDGCVRVTYRVGAPPLTEACPTPTPTMTSTPTFTPTSTPTPTDTPTPTATDTATPTSTLTPTATATATPAPRLLFSDEFDGGSLDRKKWRTSGRWGIGSSCQSDANVSVQDGYLRIRAMSDPALCNDGHTYSGQVVQTSYSGNPDPSWFSFTFGYAEARVRVPSGGGLWPSWWLYSDANNCGEIDIAEWLGQEASDSFRATVHYPPLNSGCASQSTARVTGTNWADGQWHRIGVDWQPGYIGWYADGQLVREVRDARVPADKHFLILKISTGNCGSTWVGCPDSMTVFPAYFDVDWVHVQDRR